MEVYRLIIKFKSGGDTWHIFGSEKSMRSAYNEIKEALTDFNEHQVVEVRGYCNNAIKSESITLVMIDDIGAVDLTHHD